MEKKSILVAYRESNSLINWGRSICKALRSLGFSVIPYGWNYDTNISSYKRPRAEDVDLCLWLECGDPGISRQYFELEYFPANNVPIVYWENDSEFFPGKLEIIMAHVPISTVISGSYNTLRIADRIATCQRRKIGTIFAPFAVETELFKNHAKWESRKDDLQFFGRKTNIRSAALDRLGIGMQVLSSEDYINELCTSKYCIHLYTSGGSDLIAMRPWEAMAAGCCLIIDRADPFTRLVSPEIADCLLPVDFSTITREELLAILKTRDLRTIAETGTLYVRYHHTYEARMTQIFQALGEIGMSVAGGAR